MTARSQLWNTDRGTEAVALRRDVLLDHVPVVQTAPRRARGDPAGDVGDGRGGRGRGEHRAEPDEQDRKDDREAGPTTDGAMGFHTDRRLPVSPGADAEARA